jgi:hypothetical protein
MNSLKTISMESDEEELKHDIEELSKLEKLTEKLNKMDDN